MALTIQGPPRPPGQPRVVVTEAEFTEAVDSQIPLVLNRLRRFSFDDTHLDEIIGDVRSALWESLNRWDDLDDKPSLAAWCNGVANYVVGEWHRARRPGRVPASHAPSISINDDDHPIQLAAPEPEVSDGQYLRIWAAIEDRIAAKPRGTIILRRIQGSLAHATRGARFRKLIQQAAIELHDSGVIPDHIISHIIQPAASSHDEDVSADRKRNVGDAA